MADTVLVIGVEQLSRIVDYTDRNTCVLFGDGAGAAVLRPCAPEQGILSVSIHSDGVLGDLLEIPAGGSLRPASHETVNERGHFIRMKGKELFKVAVRGMEESLRIALEPRGTCSRGPRSRRSRTRPISGSSTPCASGSASRPTR